jgi:CRP-like cAMP-binding protein
MVSVELLAKISIFSGLDTGTLAEIAKAMRETTFKSGALIFSVSDPGQQLYIVLDGRVRISVLTAEGRQISFRHVEPGEAFGEIAVFDSGPRSANATALTAVKAATLSRASFDQLATKYPAIYAAALRFVCDRLRRTSEQLEAIALHPLEVRLARLLLSMARQQDPKAQKVVRLSSRLSQGELALLIGATRPRVNDALALLEGQDAVKRESNIIVCDLEALAGIGEVDEG